MEKKENYKDLEERILLLLQQKKNGNISMQEIFQVLSGKGRSLLIIFLSLPFCQPIQIPGFSTPFGLAIAFISLRMAFGKHLWLPKALLSKSISSEKLEVIANKALLIIKKVKPWIHPRLKWACLHPIMQFANSFLICLLGIILAVPFPIPLSNLTSAWAILSIGLGILEDDGVFVILGYLITLLTFGYFILIGFSLNFIFLK